MTAAVEKRATKKDKGGLGGEEVESCTMTNLSLPTNAKKNPVLI